MLGSPFTEEQINNLKQSFKSEITQSVNIRARKEICMEDKRKAIAISSQDTIAICDDGTIWLFVPGSRIFEDDIGDYWKKLVDIPSDEEMKKQAEERVKIKADREKEYNTKKELDNAIKYQVAKELEKQSTRWWQFWKVI